MKLTSMKIDAAKLKERAEPGPSLVDQPVYPYGLQVRLDEDSLEALGMTTLPKVDSYMTLTARVCVTSVSSNEHKSTGDKGKHRHRSVELQIEAMGLEAAKKDEDADAKLYGKDS
jgi:hypothetical protein